MDSILNLTEAACAGLVIQTIISQSLNIATGSVYTFLGNSEREPLDITGSPTPYVTCHAEMAERVVPSTRIDWWKVKTNIVVVQPMHESDYATRGQIANNIFDAFLNVSGSRNVTIALPTFLCADIYDETYTNSTIENDWVQMITATFLVSPNG